jgi:hypothetical protein
MNEPIKPGEQANERFAEQAKNLFDRSVDSLDAGTLSRLNRGRHAALAELESRARSRRKAYWLPATGVAAAAVLAVMIVQGPETPDVAMDPVTASDFEILLDEESLEMFEDLEFYSWLEAADLEANGNVG